MLSKREDNTLESHNSIRLHSAKNIHVKRRSKLTKDLLEIVQRWETSNTKTLVRLKYPQESTLILAFN